MRFSLALISSAMLATVALAAPATRSANTDVNAASAAPVQAVPLNLGEMFQPFHFSVKDDAKVVDRTFTLDLAEPAELQITDYMLGGDSFQVLDNGVVLGSTISGAETNQGDSIMAETPEGALQDDRFSRASFALPAGHHEISLNVAASPYNDGTGAIRVVRHLNALYKDDDDEDDDKWGKDDDDEDCEDDEDDGKWGKKEDDDKWGKKEDGDKWEYKKGKKTYYIYSTVTASAPPSSAAPTQTIVEQTTTGTVTEVVTDVETSTVVQDTTAYFLLSLPWLTI